jgi:2-methylcitrate dehydratase PrpD
MAVAVTAEIARKAAHLAWTDFPDDLVERTKQCLLDWFAVTVAGAQDELTDILVREAMDDGARGSASLVGRTEKTLPSAAALINGAASHALDYDDVNFAMGGHPTVTVVPALLALGEQIKASGRLFVESFVAGYETSGRVGRLVAPSHYLKGFHVTGTGRLVLRDRRGRPHARPHRPAARRRLRHRRDPGRRPQVELRNDVQAAARRHGVRARPARRPPRRQGLHRARRLAGMRPGLRLLAERSSRDRIGPRRAAAGLAPAQQPLQAPCELLPDSFADRVRKEIRLKSNFPPERVRKITLRIEEGADKVCNIANPTSGLEAKFSLRQTVAMALTGVDTANVDSYSAEITQEPRIKALRDKMTIEFEPGWAKSVAEMAIQLDDGTTLSATHDSGVPWADVAKQRRALETKFDSLVAPVLGAAGARRLHDAIERIDTLADVGELARASTK